MSLFTDASLVMIPSGIKDQKIYSVTPTDGSGDLTFTRSNDTATRVGSDGLIEKVRTNLQTYSQDFSNAVWVKSAGATLTHSQTDPNGGTTASRLQMPSGTSNYFAASAISGLTNGGQYTHSVYMKSNTGSTQSVRILDGVRGAAGGTLLASVTTSWQRFEVVITTASTSAGLQIDNVAGTYNNDILIAFAQSEVSDFGATDYIATTSAAVSVGPVANLPRLDYSGGATCPRLLLEPQRTNVHLHSEYIADAYWLKFQCTITSNQAVSPDGYNNASLLTANASGVNVIYRGGVSYGALSFFAKADNLSAGARFHLAVDTVGYANWNQDGTLYNQSGGLVSATDGEYYGNGWYRFTYVVGSGSVQNFGLSNSTSGDTCYIYGVQSESSASYSSSYIPTYGAAVTRGGELAQKSSISGLFGATATTFVLDFVKKENAIGWTITGGNGSKLFSLCQFDTLAGYPRVVFDDGVDTASSLAALSNGPHKIAISYATNDTRVYIDGTLVLTDTSCTYYQMDRIGVNATSWTGYTNNTNAFEINQFLMIPAATSNADLAALTA